MKLEKGEVSSSSEGDTLSALPDEILCYILSLVATKDAVATSVLSTRWRNLYRSVPVIDFDESLIPQSGELVPNTLIGFVDKVLSERNVFNLMKFRLRCKNVRDSSKLNEWICAALCHNVQDLDIWTEWDLSAPVLTDDVFACKSLVSLKVHRFGMFVPEIVSLANLKVLKLDNVVFPVCDDGFKRLLAGCKSLEDLHLIDCYLEDVKILDFSSPTLRTLALVRCVGFIKIIVDNPNLVYLDLHIGSFEEEYVIKNMKSLERAYVDFVDQQYSIVDEGCFSKIINELRNVKVLSLHGEVLQGLVHWDFQMPAFQNLKGLDIGPCTPGQWEIIASLLDNAPYLAILHLCMGYMYYVRYCEILFQMPQRESKLPHLREVKIVDFHAFEYELFVIKYLLQKGEALEIVKFAFSEKGKSAKSWPYSAMKRLLEFRRCSKTCKIVLP